MEDILASIRRIIADDQSRTSGFTVGALRQSVMPQNVLRESTPVAETQAAPEAVSAPPSDPADPIEEPVAHPAVPHLNPPQATDAATADEASVVDAIANAGVASILRPRFATSAPTAEAPAALEPSAANDAQPHVAPAYASADHEADLEGEPAFEEAPPEFYEEEAAEAEIYDGGPLISSTAGASVGSSFQALATTVFMQNTDMLEPMMRDMLRPMLKTWLDDNLPSIVERLVRAEIERVSRGTRF